MSSSNKLNGKRKRASYEAHFKIKAAEYAIEHNNCKAADKFGVSEKQVRDWRKGLDQLRKGSRTKRANRFTSCHHPELEKVLLKWIQEQRYYQLLTN